MAEIPNDNMTFEEAIPHLDELLKTHRSKWTLKAVPYDDVSQNIRMHVFEKWHLYDPKLPVRPWLTRIIQHQMRNMLRDEYYVFLPPCRKCEMYLGEDRCKLYEKVSSRCKLIEKYNKTKLAKENIKFAVSYDTIPYDGIQDFSMDVREVADLALSMLSGQDAHIFELYYKSGFSLTRVAQYYQEASGITFNMAFGFAKTSIKKAKLAAVEIIEEKKATTGHY